jgi:hypothetical protein
MQGVGTDRRLMPEDRGGVLSCSAPWIQPRVVRILVEVPECVGKCPQFIKCLSVMAYGFGQKKTVKVEKRFGLFR